MSTKRCSKCMTVQDLSVFGNNKNTYDGLNAWCRYCCSASDKARRLQRKTEDPNWRRASHNWQLYRLTPEQYTKLVSKGCHICGRTDQTLDIDHDHSCCPGKRSCGACVRGALCRRCNLRLSYVEDSEFMYSTKNYLEKWGKCL